MVESDLDGESRYDDSIEIPDRTRRALEEPLTVVDLDGTPVEDDATVVLVVSHSGESYRVDARAGVCECPDSKHRDPDGGCKHVRRARAALDREPLDARVVAAVDVDETLGTNAPGPSVVASDGGSAEFTERADALNDDVDADGLEDRYDDAAIVDAEEPDEWDGPHREFDRYGRPTGESYLRCPACGVEVLEQHLDSVTHADGCEFEENDDGSAEITGTDTPRRSEPADFGLGDSTGVQEL
jgi:hypothetical protein